MDVNTNGDCSRKIHCLRKILSFKIKNTHPLTQVPHNDLRLKGGMGASPTCKQWIG